jgi:outer membrane autotransporter protein
MNHRRQLKRRTPQRFPLALLTAGLSNGFVLPTICVATLFALGLAPARAQDATWAGPGNDWNTATNWSPTTVPTGVATFAGASPTSITFNAPANVGTLQFDAPGYTFTYLPFAPNLTIDGDGIQVNAGGGNPTFNITQDAPMNFHNNSTAGNATIVAGESILVDPDGFQAGFIKFFDNSTASTADITAQSGSNIEFHDTSTAGNATLISAAGGDILFTEHSTAGNATITVQDQGFMEFGHLDLPEFGGGPASAGNAQITIDPGGFARFQTEATAGNATITSSGTLEFDDTSSAGSATITTTTPSGVTNFHDTSNAGTATFTVTGEGVMNFFDQSSAGAASIHVDGTSSVNFNAGSTAGTAKIIAGDMGSTDDFTGGFIFFEGNSTADHAMITAFGDSNIEFDDASHAGNATLIAGLPTRPIGADTNGFIFFTGTSSAENATITVNQFAELSFAPGFFGGGTATAGNANITNNGNTNFYQGSSAENATITTNDGGLTSFFGRSTGGNATLITNAGGIVDISGLGTFPDSGEATDPSRTGTTAGSIAGAGTYFLGSKQLTIGSNNLSTTVSGTIEDGGLAVPGATGGSLVKVGTGTLTSDGAGTYTGGTTVSEGALVVGDFAHPSAALSGGGPIAIGSGGTLGGYGSVTGSVANSGVIAAGNAAPGLASSPAGTFTIIGNLLNGGAIQLASGENIGNVLEVRGSYIGAGGTMAINTFLGGDGSPSDRLVINGDPAATGNTSVHVTNVGGPGAETTNGILVVNAINGATTAPGAFTLANPELRAGAFDYDLFRGGVGGASPNDWFLRSSFTGGGGGVPLPIPPFPSDPPPNPLPPNVLFPIIGPELAAYGVVQPLARQLGLSILGTLDDRVGDTYEPDGCAVAPVVAPAAATPAVDLPTRKPAAVPTKKPGLAPCPLFSPSVWGRFFGQTVHNRYSAFADPRADGNLGGFQGGIDLLRGPLIPGGYDRAGLYGAYGDVNSDVTGLVTNPAATAYVLTRTGSMNLDAWSAGGYWTHTGPGGWYLDAVLQGTWYYGSASTQFARLNTDGTGFIGSMEGGYPFAWPQLGPGFVIEPQGQILWQKVSFRHDYDGEGDVALGDTTGPSGRIGLRTKWTIVTAGGQVWQPYLRGNLWRDWGAEASTVFSGTDSVPLVNQATMLEFGGGLTGRINANVSVFANVDYEFAVGAADDKRNGVRGAFGARYTW